MGQSSTAGHLDRTNDRDPNDAEIAWAAEIERRVEEIRSGRAELVSSEQLFQELDAIIDEPDEEA